MNVDGNRDIAAEKARDHYQRAEQQMEKATALPHDGVAQALHLQMAQTHALLSICNLLSVGFGR